MMENFIKAFTLLSPFISAYLVYVLAIKGKRKDIDIEKEKELNTVLSNFLLVWNYLTRIEQLIDILLKDDLNSIVPKKHFSIIFLKSGFLNDDCFKELDNSITILKKYDPILFFKLQGSGKLSDLTRENYIFPFIKNPETSSDLLKPISKSFKDSLEDFEKSMQRVAARISNEMSLKVSEYINNHIDTDVKDIIEKTNQSYYEAIIEFIPETLGRKPTFEEFEQVIMNDYETKKIIEFQFELILNNQLDEFLKIINDDPNISIEDLQVRINKIGSP